MDEQSKTYIYIAGERWEYVWMDEQSINYTPIVKERWEYVWMGEQSKIYIYCRGEVGVRVDG